MAEPSTTMTKKDQTSSTFTIFLVSDSTGETAEKISLAALAQFAKTSTQLLRRRYVRTEDQIEDVVKEAKPLRALIIFTLVDKALRMKMRTLSLKSGLLAVDLLGPLLTAMSHFLDTPANAEPGRLHRIDTDYFGRVDAVQFTVKHDDGQYLHGATKADIVLIGPSRTAKTPLSIYLARFGYKVSNIPLVLDIPLPAVLEEVDPNRVVALKINPHRLLEIRAARLKKLNQATTDYANLGEIVKELNYCLKLYKAHPKWGVIDVTGRAIEEVATDVMSWVRKRDPLRSGS